MWKNEIWFILYTKSPFPSRLYASIHKRNIWENIFMVLGMERFLKRKWNALNIKEMIIKLDYTNIKNLHFSKTPLREYSGHSNMSFRFLLNEELVASPAGSVGSQTAAYSSFRNCLSHGDLPCPRPHLFLGRHIPSEWWMYEYRGLAIFTKLVTTLKHIFILKLS